MAMYGPAKVAVETERGNYFSHPNVNSKLVIHVINVNLDLKIGKHCELVMSRYELLLVQG